MNLSLKIKQREKRVLIIGGIIVVLILVYSFITWYKNAKISMEEHLQAKRTVLEKQFNKISEKEKLKKKIENTDSEVKNLESGLLPNDKPPLAAAEIQRILKQTAFSLNIDINLEKTLAPVDYGQYLGIPVEIGFTTSTAKLNNLLYMIKTSQQLLTITEIKIRVTNIADPTDIYASLIVTGFISKSQPQTKKTEAKKDA